MFEEVHDTKGCARMHVVNTLVALVQGDVYHLLFNLGEWLDGRVWLKKDRLDVQRLLDLIHHVTGTQYMPTGLYTDRAPHPCILNATFCKMSENPLC